MDRKIEPTTPLTDSLAGWLEAGESLLEGLSSIFTVLSKGKGEGKLPSDEALKLLSRPLNVKTVTDFRDHSIQLLSTLQKLVQEKEGTQPIPKTPSASKEPTINPAKQAPVNREFTVASATQTILREVVQSLDLLASAEMGTKVAIVQLHTVYDKIQTVITELVKPIKTEHESDFTNRESVKVVVQSEEKKSQIKQIPIPAFEGRASEKKTLEERRVQPKGESVAVKDVLESRPAHKGETNPANLPPRSAPTKSEGQTTIAGAPYQSQVDSQNRPYREKKRRKFPWERDEYDDEEKKD